MSVTTPTVRPATAVLEDLLDPGSLSAIRTHVRSSSLDDGPDGDGVLCGSGRLSGRRVFCYAQDRTVLGGSLGATHADSMCRTLDSAARSGAPVIGIHSSGGARIQEGVDALAGYARVFARHVRLRRRVPQIGLVLGPCAGGAAYGPALMDFVVMPQDGAYLFLTGPDVVREVTGEDVGPAELGGAEVAGRSGLASLVATGEDDTVDLTRRLFDYLPQTIGAAPPGHAHVTAPATDPSAVVPMDPRATYDVRGVIAEIADVGSFLEIKPSFAPNLVTGLARLDGATVGVIANQPQVLAGAIDIAAAGKGEWFVKLCDRFGFPLVVLVDTPGFLPGTAQELGGVIPAGAAFLAAFVEADVPKVTVVLRKAYGGAFIVMNARDLGADRVYAWPTAEIAVLGARGAVRILERRRLAAADDPETLQRELEAEYRTRWGSPWPAAHAGHVDEVIDPRHTRSRLLEAFIA